LAVVSGCSRYIVASMRVRLDRPLPRAVRILEGAKARLDYVDEEQRRITADIPASRVGVLDELADYCEYLSLEVKASCRLRGDPRGLVETLRDMGFERVPGGSAVVLVGRWAGRAVEVEIRAGRVRVKVGARVTGKPRPPLPPSVFLVAPEELGEALEALNGLLGELRGKA